MAKQMGDSYLTNKTIQLKTWYFRIYVFFLYNFLLFIHSVVSFILHIDMHKKKYLHICLNNFSQSLYCLLCVYFIFVWTLNANATNCIKQRKKQKMQPFYLRANIIWFRKCTQRWAALRPIAHHRQEKKWNTKKNE